LLLLDTSVASLLHPRKSTSSRLKLYEPDLLGQTLAVSFQTVAELLEWAEERGWGDARRKELDAVLAKLVVVPYEIELARSWAKVMVHARSVGRRLEAGDAWIAASAVRHGLALVTHDRDFLALGIPGLQVICRA
jgi:predicted nucleic acid-binding protein